MTLRQILAVCVVFLGLGWVAPSAKADPEQDRVEAIGADLCKAVRSMDGEPILKSYSIRGNTLTMKVVWSGLITGNKYTSDITIMYARGTTGKIDSISYVDTCAIPKYDLDYVEKWRRAQK